MAFVPSTDPATQLVTLNLESDTTVSIEGITAIVTAVIDITGTVVDPDAITCVVEECDG